MQKLTDKFNSIAVKRGEMFSVELRAASDGGYSWNVMVTAGKATLLARDSMPLADALPDAIGNDLIDRFLFKADEEGTIELKAMHQRPWEANPLETKKLKVKVS